VIPQASPTQASVDEDLDRLRTLLATSLELWSSPIERRRLRAFGFRPAVEPGVLKREYRGLNVRVSDAALRAALPGVGELYVRRDDASLLLDGRPFEPSEEGREVAEALVAMIQDYERWVEAREGREERIARARRIDVSRATPRPYNTLAETRRLQRIMQQGPRGGR
jgi:hypothetical protein